MLIGQVREDVVDDGQRHTIVKDVAECLLGLGRFRVLDPCFIEFLLVCCEQPIASGLQGPLVYGSRFIIQAELVHDRIREALEGFLLLLLVAGCHCLLQDLGGRGDGRVIHISHSIPPLHECL